MVSSPRNQTAPGEGGIAVTLSEEEKVIADKRFGENSFNVYVSDKISLERGIPDSRPDE